MVKVLVTTSDNYEPVFNIFKASLANCPYVDLVINKIDLSTFGRYGFLEESWYNAIMSKIEFVRRFISEQSDGEYVIVTDADIQFLQPLRIQELIDNATKESLDYYGMREDKRPEYNGGFYIVRCGPKIQAFLDEVCTRMKTLPRQKYGDQEILNELLKHNPHGLNHSHIDTKYTIWGNGQPTCDSIFHHAVLTRRTNDKLFQMQMVQQKYNIFSKRRK